MSPTLIRVATWNIHWAAGQRAERLGGLLSAEGDADAVLLQEANPKAIPRFCAAAGLTWWHSAQLASSEENQSRRRHSVAIAGRGGPPVQLLSLPAVPLPEKLLAAELRVGRHQRDGCELPRPARRHLADVRARRPAGPLTISFDTRRHIKKPPRSNTKYRYDAIWVSPEFEVLDVRYLYQQALDAGAAHALVLATLAVVPGR